MQREEGRTLRIRRAEEADLERMMEIYRLDL